ncbi:mechanosensitive channel MscK, partial [Pseudomonas aeruginosa]|nr:mechanosensitive channel MscK [Pseudomonas aeruginosa]
MPALRSLIAILFLGLCLASPPLLAQSEPPSAETVQQSLDKLAERKLAEADQKVAKASLEQTLKFLAARDEALQSLEDLKKRLSDAPRQIEENQRELERLKKTKERPVSERYSGESAARLEMLLNDRTTQQAEWQKALGEANSLSITAETRPERAQAGISSMQARILEIGSLLKAGKESGKTINADRRGELLAEQAALTVQSQLLRQELAGNNLLQDLGKSQHDLLTEKISRLEKETLDLQALISEKRREQSEKTVAELSKEGAQGAGTDSLLSQENAKNLRLSDYLLRATDRLNVLTRRNLETKQQLDNLTQSNQALEEQINVLRGSLLLSRILYKQKQALPKIKADQSLADEIADLRLGQFELNQERDKLATPQQYLDDLLAQQPSEQVTPELRKDLDTLLATRSELLERLNHELNALLNEAITLQLNQKQLLSTSESLRTTLDEQMFWIPSNQPLDLSWFKMTPTLLKNQLTEIPWGSGVRELGEGLVDRPLLFLPLFLLIAALLWKRRYLYDKLAELNDDIGHFKRDSQLHTPLAILITILLALPGTLTFAVAGLALLLDARGQNATLGSALLEMAQVWLLFYTAHRILTPGGIAERHFHWSREQVGFLDRHLVRLGVVVLALVGVVTVAEHQPASLADDVIGIAVVLLGYAAMAWLLSRLLFSSPGDERPSLIKMIVGILFTALPLVLFVAVCFGYYYTSLKLTDRLIDTLYLLLLWFVIEAAFVRGLGVAARRLAYARALAKRQNAAKEGVDGETNVEEPTLGIEQINQQSLRLIRLALLIGFIVCLYWVWADLISVISYLDNVTLYQYTAGTGEAATSVPISLRDFLAALAIAVVTVALARNL